MQPGPKNLITDVKGLRVGNAQDDATEIWLYRCDCRHAVHCICACDGRCAGNAGNRSVGPR